MKILDLIVGWYTRVLAGLAGIITVLIVIVLMANVVMRPLGAPIYGVVDIVQYMLLTLIMASLAFVQSTDSHISVDVVTERFPRAVKRWFEFAAQALTFVVTILLAAVLLYVSLTSGSALDGSGLLPIPALPFKVLSFLGFLGWALQALRLAVHFILDKDFTVKSPNEVTE